MSASSLIEIKIVKTLAAPKWKVIRLLTRPWEFPEYISFIKEVSVVQKTNKIIKTKWRVTVEKITINWVEEDTFAWKQNRICFKALEGDLEEFSGEWTIKEHPEGAEVCLNAYIKVGVPGIGEYAEAQIRKLFTKTFEAIIDAFEHRLITKRYADYKGGASDKIGGFGLIGHPYNYNHLVRYLQSL
ncbi:MAG: hypothetical protein HY920_01255, partial [Elusimicrobia bacterium]|nr:hypothetical protein [Elusimicrobiota bacterium]